MTLLFFDGFESGSTTRPEWVPNTIGVFTSLVRTGSYSMYGFNNVGTSLPITPSAQVVCGFAFFPNQTASIGLLSIYGDSNVTQHLTLMWNSSTTFLELRRGGTGGTLLATSAVPWPVSQWRHIQVKAKIDPTAGFCQVKQDGVTIIDFTGNTKNAGTSNNIDALRFILNSNSNYTLDDLWVCDGVDATATQGRAYNDYLGDLKVVGLLPSAAGDLTQFTPSTGANWSCVDDPTVNSSDYVTSTAAGQRDLYTMADLPAGVSTVYGVRVTSYAQKTDAGLEGIKHVIKENSVVTVDASPTALSSTFAFVHGATLYKKPSNSTLWTVTDVNALQCGFDSVAM